MYLVEFIAVERWGFIKMSEDELNAIVMLIGILIGGLIGIPLPYWIMDKWNHRQRAKSVYYDSRRDIFLKKIAEIETRRNKRHNDR